MPSDGGRSSRARRGVVLVGGDLVDLVSGEAALEDTVPAWFMLAAAYGVGFALRGQRVQSTLLARRAERLEQEREQRARLAVAEERVRIARELHDIIAHTISVMVVQAQAGQRVLEGEQASAREALGSIETTGRQALVEMRRLLGMLRNEDASSRSPRDRAWRMSMSSPSACGMRGLPVDLQIEGEAEAAAAGCRPVRLPDRAGGADQRAAARRAGLRAGHRPLPARDVELEITDDGRGTAAATRQHGGARPGRHARTRGARRR